MPSFFILYYRFFRSLHTVIPFFCPFFFQVEKQINDFIPDDSLQKITLEPMNKVCRSVVCVLLHYFVDTKIRQFYKKIITKVITLSISAMKLQK